jgi:hypothetical protein
MVAIQPADTEVLTSAENGQDQRYRMHRLRLTVRREVHHLARRGRIKRGCSGFYRLFSVVVPQRCLLDRCAAVATMQSAEL